MADVKKQLAVIEKKLLTLEKKLLAFESVKAVTTTKPTKPKVVRSPSRYNKFMSSEGRKVKKANPSMGQPDVMREVARRWNEQK